MSADDSHVINFAGGTDTGKVRAQNEDSILCYRFEHGDVCLLLVADGVGGHEGGAVASKLAVNTMKELVSKSVMLANSGGGYTENWLEQTLLHAITETNQHILEQQQKQPAYANMATTIVAMLIKEQDVVLTHLGDSRCYQYSDSAFSQITEDHTVLQQLLNEGKIDQQQFQVLPLHHVISQALGLSEDIEVIIHHLSLSQDTLFLLCSDGLTNCVSDAQIQHVLQTNGVLQACVDDLITRANDNGGNDNISVVLVSSGEPVN